MSHYEILRKAQLYQDKISNCLKDDLWKPKYHVTAPANWINDPNGFCYFNGKYHLFYQYHPYSVKWGPMHWGHVASSDLVEWETLPIALAPSEEYDKDGCFSGSAIVSQDKLYLLYTGHVDLDKNIYHTDRIETQCLASSADGINFEKMPSNPVIKLHSNLANIKAEHFRDPKIWKHEDLYYTVIGAQTIDERGQVLIYKSADLVNWQFVNIMATSTVDENLGFMWECPNFAEINGQEALIISPQGVSPEGNKFLNLHQTGYFLGKMDYTTGKFTRKTTFDLLDYGFDFYAAQIMQDEVHNRCLMMSWLDMWESEMPEQANGWAGMMSIPRILEIQDNSIYSKPIPELRKLRTSHINFKSGISAETLLKDMHGSCYELITDFNLDNASGFELKLRVSATEETIISYNKNTKLLTLNRDKSGIGPKGERQVSIEPVAGNINLQIFSDKSSLEIFVNGGQRVLSTRIYPSAEAENIILIPQGNIEANIDFYAF